MQIKLAAFVYSAWKMPLLHWAMTLQTNQLRQEIKLALIKENDDWYIEAHNPTDREIHAVIQIAEWLNGIIPMYNELVALQPGSISKIKI